MSAVIYLKQRNAAYFLTDAAGYFADGTLASIDEKCVAIERAHCALTVLGPARWQSIISDAIQLSFNSFDEVQDGIEALSRELFRQHEESFANFARTWGAISPEVWVAGWSIAKNRPECFRFFMCSDAEYEGHWKQRTADLDRVPFKPERMWVHIAAAPVPNDAELASAPQLNDPDALDPHLDLLHLMEIQRRHRFTATAGSPYRVGGHATLTSITATGITQERIHTWPEDCVGDVIRPKPIDYKQWRAERVREKLPAGLSRLKRDMLLKKAAKGRLRVVA